MWITKLTLKNQVVTRILPVDNPVDKMWIKCGHVNYPQKRLSYAQGYPQACVDNFFCYRPLVLMVVDASLWKTCG